MIPFLFAIFFSPTTHALEPLTDELTFGVPSGVYEGEGVLASRELLVPDLEFISRRNIGSGVIEATTIASFLGLEMASASARLRVIPKTDRSFILRDLDRGEIEVGGGSCDSGGCRFEARVMEGRLLLRETWSPNKNGFELKDASQSFDGLKATYGALFRRTKK